MFILQIRHPEELKQIMRDIKVDSYGIEIMLPKAISHLIRINSLPCIAANILKQEMLSLGGDAAVAKDALTARAKKTDCLLMGNLSQFNRLNEKLNKQPFGLNKLAKDLSSLLANYQRDNFRLNLGKYKLTLRQGKTYIMAIVNLTPDSFSKDGLLGKGDLGFIEQHICGLVEDGADIIDIGGESTRPGAKPISLREEINRTIPLIKRIGRKIKIPISIDTYKPEVAQRALDSGASMVNDIMGVRNNPRMLKVIKSSGAAVVLMHIQGLPQTMQKNPGYQNLMGEIIASLKKSLDLAISFGINREKIIVDPGIGFGKTLEQNLEIIKRLSELKSLGRPILIGPSRKSFIGKILNLPVEDRLMGTAAAVVVSILNGAKIVRVHDCRAIKQLVKITDSILPR